MGDRPTKEQIMNLGIGEEIDILVLENIWDWERLTPRQHRKRTPFDLWSSGIGGVPLYPHNQLPRISKKLKLAWKTVDFMTREDRDVPLYFKCYYRWTYENIDRHPAYAAFDDKGMADRHPLYTAQAEEMPLAICKAALLAEFQLL